MPAAWAGVAATVVGTAASLAKGSGQSSAAAGGAAAANGISQEAINDAKGYRDADRANAQPFLTQGTGATNRLGDILGLNGADAARAAMSGFTSSPGYAYQVDQGLRAVDSGAAAQGMLHSGATIRAEQTLGNSLADQDFGNYLGRLSALSNTGLQGAALNNQGTGTLDGLLSKQTSDMASTANSLGTNQASIYGNTVGSLSNGIGGFLNSDTGKNALGKLFPAAGSTDFGGAGGFYSA